MAHGPRQSLEDDVFSNFLHETVVVEEYWANNQQIKYLVVDALPMSQHAGLIQIQQHLQVVDARLLQNRMPFEGGCTRYCSNQQVTGAAESILIKLVVVLLLQCGVDNAQDEFRESFVLMALFIFQ